MPEYPDVPGHLRAAWDELLAPTPEPAPYRPELAAHLPAPVRRWLDHAIVAGTLLRRRIEMRQRGQIRLGGRWWPIQSRQALDPLRGYVWPVCTLRIGPDGALHSATAPRWAQLGDGPWQWHTFGAGAFIRLVVDDAVAH